MPPWWVKYVFCGDIFKLKLIRKVRPLDVYWGGQCFGGLSIILFRVRFVLKLTARMVVEVGNCFMVVCMK